MRGLSMFAGAGIGETYLNDCGIDIVVANELVDKRATLYKKLYPNCKMICGDITNSDVFDKVIEFSDKIDFLIASPPCQGMSVAGKNRCKKTMMEDERNYLICYVIKAIKLLKPKYIIIENVPRLLNLHIMYNGKVDSILNIINKEFSKYYSISYKIIDAADCGVPQTRLRAIIKLYPKDEKWEWPNPVEHKVTVREAIGDLPSLESGEKSNLKWHYARNHDPRHVICMKHTATGETAFSNREYYPKKKDGTKVKGYNSSYRRIKWDEPAPTITIRSDAISSQRNVHPGRLLEDGTFSDARVLTPYEIMILNSLPSNWNIPDDTPELLIRQIIGESIPPLMIKRIVGELECIKKIK